MALVVNDANIEEVLKSDKPVVLDFWAEWCGPCRMIGPIIDELAEEYKDKVIIGKVNIEEDSDDVVSEYGIRNVPTIIFLKDGKVADKLVGAAQKSAFVEKIEALLK